MDRRPGGLATRGDRDHIRPWPAVRPATDVVLLHDWIEQPWAPSALDRSATVAALPGIVAAVRKRGDTLDRLRS